MPEVFVEKISEFAEGTWRGQTFSKDVIRCFNLKLPAEKMAHVA